MSDSSGSWASDSSSERSYRSDLHDPVCEYRTRRFHHHECSRYFDCPGHTLERSNSEQENSDEGQDEQEHDEYGSGGERASDDASTPDHDHRPLQAPPSDVESMSSRQRGKAPEHAVARREVVDLTASSPEAGPSNAAESSASGAHAASRHEPVLIDLTEDTPPPEQVAEASSGERALPTLPTVGSNSSIYSTRRATEADSPAGHRRPGTPPSPPPPTRRRTSNNNLGSASRSTHTQPQRPSEGRRPSDIVLPRWQPDAEVTICPICHTQFSIFVRKHHCRYVTLLTSGFVSTWTLTLHVFPENVAGWFAPVALLIVSQYLISIL